MNVLRTSMIAAAVLSVVGAGGAAAQSDTALRRVILPSVAALEAESHSRPFPDTKIGSHLLDEIGGGTGPKSVPAGRHITALSLKSDAGTVLVDITTGADLEAVVSAVVSANGTVKARIASAHLVQAEVPVGRIRDLARRPDVVSIEATPPGDSNQAGARFVMQGDIAHTAERVRNTLHVGGEKVGVALICNSLYDTPTAAADAKRADAIDMSMVHILRNEGDGSNGECLAMLEILHTIAPTADLSVMVIPSNSAQLNEAITALTADKTINVIVDDLVLRDEPPFGGGFVEAAVQKAVDSGKLYFGVPGNNGNVVGAWSGSWEGWFEDGGDVAKKYSSSGKAIPGHWTIFAHVGDRKITLLTVQKPRMANHGVNLYWNDQEGNVRNVYHLYVVNAQNQVVGVANSNALRTPHQWVKDIRTGNSVIVVRPDGSAPAFLHVEVGSSPIDHPTPGSARGHANVESTRVFSVGAVPTTAPPNTFDGTDTPVVEQFSSDGPRLVFFDSSGNAIAGPLSPALPHGGKQVRKPDLAAADQVSTTVVGVRNEKGLFGGTSAAAPQAAGIAALLLSCPSHPSVDAVAEAMRSTARKLPESPDSIRAGSGIVIAMNAASRLCNPQGAAAP